MIFNKHYEFDEDDHAFLSPSSPHWLNYDLAKLENRYANWEAAKMGTRYHAFAKEAILLRKKMPKTRKTLDMYINDAIGFRMTPEVMLVYSENCFGTADAISFNDNFLRIHDLKTGVTPGKISQLEVYAALFCLEYEINPNEIDMELRIYQNDEILVHIPDRIEDVITIIMRQDKHISALKQF